LACTCGWSQKAEYDFYREFRNVLTPQFRSQDPSISPEGIAERYAKSFAATASLKLKLLDG